MRPSLLLFVFVLLVGSQRGTAQQAGPAPTPAAPEVIRLVGGSALVGRVTATGGGKIHMYMDGVGDVLIDSAAVVSRSPVPPPAAAPSPWSGTVTGSMTHISTVAPGIKGSTLGAQVTLGVARSGARGTLGLEGTLSYWRVEPSTADVEDWGLALGGRRILAPRWVLLARTKFDVNRVQFLQYRTTTLAGVGYLIAKSDRVSLLFAPGLGYGKSEQTAEGRALSFAAGIPPSVEGLITGVHDILTVQLTPTLSFQQDMHYFWSLRRTPYRQADFNAKLLGMISTHVGLSIAFKQQYDSSMPPPVNRNLRSLISGVQVKL
jgi:hypothetical protein